jgi:hypothetical protein
MFSLGNGVVSSLLGSEGGTVHNGLSKESNIVTSGSELILGGGQENLGVGDGLLTLDLGSGVGVSVSSGAGNFSLTGHDILVMLRVGS